MGMKWWFCPYTTTVKCRPNTKLRGQSMWSSHTQVKRWATQAPSWATSLWRHIYAQHRNRGLGHSVLCAIRNVSYLVLIVVLLNQRLSPAWGILRIQEKGGSIPLKDSASTTTQRTGSDTLKRVIHSIRLREVIIQWFFPRLSWSMFNIWDSK